MDVTKVRELNLCVSCEICNVVCPVDAIDMEFKQGQFLPNVDQETCIDCEKCIEVCPGLDITIFDDENIEDKITGSYIEGYSAYTKNRDILKGSTSGGTITQLIIDLLKEGEYEGAFVLPFDMFDGEQIRLCLAETEEEVKKASKSKYLPASDYNVVKKLEDEDNPNYIVVGTPCQLSGIKNFLELKNIDEEGLLFLGLFCDKTLNLNFLDYIEEKHADEAENLVKFEYRDKEKDGWPGHVKARFDSGREEIIDRKERMQVKEFFQLERCLYCLDKLNPQADISFGDCYIPGKENPGRSSIIIRTEKGKEVWDKYKDSFNWEGSSVESIKRSQGISQKKENLEFAKVLVNKYDLFEEKASKPDRKTKKKLKKRKKNIRLGKSRKYGKIKTSISLEKWRNTFEDGFEIGKKGKDILRFYLKDTISTSRQKNIDDNENIVIFGGGFSNKGAQGMTFTVVDQMRIRFPDKKIYLLSNDYKRDIKEKRQYAFNILPFDLDLALDLLLDNSSHPSEKHNHNYKKVLKKIFTNTSAFIDISGYHLSSQMTPGIAWGLLKQWRYLTRIMLAKKFSKLYFILPQSLGPFDYKLLHKPFLSPLLKRYLKYPQKIYPREDQGANSLKKFTKNNVRRERDIVLLNGGYDLDNIFRDNIELKELTIPNNSVGLIPNNQVMKRSDEKKIYDMYGEIIRTLREKDKKVYILRHSQQDLYICENIKKLFEDDDNPEVILDDLNAIELEKVIEQFDFIIGSRYHSIIHAYKNGIPAVVIGWAVKYKELLKEFDQMEYIFDVREDLEKTRILAIIEKMADSFEKQQEMIEKRLDSMEKNTVFDEVETSILNE